MIVADGSRLGEVIIAEWRGRREMAGFAGFY
jgi:hypothetical protein